MPTIKYYQALSYETLSEVFDTDSFRQHAVSATKMSYTDKDGDSIELRGTDFKYSPAGEVREGTVSSIVIRDADGHLLQTIKNIHPDIPAIGHDPAVPGDAIADASYIYDNFKTYSATALPFIFNGDGDHLIGSKKADLMNGGDGWDSVSGGGGNDIISGGSGRDQLTGGGGKDMFYFQRGEQQDSVTDFEIGRDRVEVQQAMYDRLEKHQVGDDVVLDFGFGDQLILENTHKSSIDKDDFFIIA